MTIINPHTNTPVQTYTAVPDDAEPVMAKRRDYLPAPGRVTVLRDPLDTHYVKDDDVDIVKVTDAWDEMMNVYATVARIGRKGDEPLWFDEGDSVTIEPSLFREVKLTNELSVWIGPHAAITGVFTERPLTEE